MAAGSSSSSGSAMPKSLQSKGTTSSSTSAISKASASSGKQSSTISSSSSNRNSSSTSTGMPKITTSTSSNSTGSGGSGISSSYTVTFTPLVPTSSNPEIQIPKLPSGTTFIAVGGVLGLVFSALIFTRVLMACISSNRAKKGNMMQNQPQEFDYDPTLFPEKSLMKNTSRAFVYSLGSTSTLNVLGSQASMEQLIAPGGRSLRTALMNNNSRASMFISPTEVLVNQQLYGRSHEDNGYFSYDSPIESPSTGAYAHSTPSLGDLPQEQTRQDPRKRSRPPSVFMEQLFNDEQSIQDNSENGHYDNDAHNRV